MVHTFKDKLREAEEHERRLDEYFAEHFEISEVGIKDQKRGIDRVFKSKSGAIRTVEYKCDSMAAKTGNVFIETISNDRTGQEGWIFKIQADLLIYYIPPTGEIIAIRPQEIWKRMPEWIQRYRAASARNPSYCSYGRIVPLREFRKAARWTANVKDS
jgi:hypothetical protein